MAAPTKPQYEDETVAVFGEELFSVDVLTRIGTVRNDPKSRLKPDEAAFMLIAQHARTLSQDENAEYHFPGMTVTVVNHGFDHESR